MNFKRLQQQLGAGLPGLTSEPSTSRPGLGLRHGLLVALVYVLAGRAGLLLAVPPGYATAIFPPAGIAMASVVVGGQTMLPWVFAGSCLLNLWIGNASGQPAWQFVASALCIAAASMLQAAVGTWALGRFLQRPIVLDSARDLARFLLISPAACCTSATLSLGSMTLLGAVSLTQFGANWFTWWIGDTLGVLLFLPLVMIVAGEPRDAWRPRARSVGAPMLLFFALFVAIFVRTRAWERDQSLVEFRLLSQSFTDKLQYQLVTQEMFLQQLCTVWSGSRIDRSAFDGLTARLLQRFPAIQAIAWVPRVAADDRAAFEAAAQRDQPGFAFREVGPDGAMRPADNRPVFYPIVWLSPLQGNATALGFDLGSDAIRSAAVRQATRTGNATATAPIRLVQAPVDPTGLLLIEAVPAGPNGPGVLAVVLRMDVLTDAVLGSMRSQIAVELADRSAGPPLFDNLSPERRYAVEEHQVTFGGRRYSLTTMPTAMYASQHRTWQSWAVLVIGVLSTSLLGAVLMLSTGERQRFSRLLAERTRERDRIWQVSEDLLGVGNFDGYFPSVNPAWTRTLGWSEEEIHATHVDQLRHPDDAPIGIEGRRRLAEGAGTVRMENRFRHKDGSYRWIYWTMTAQQGVIYLIGRDVTADKEAARRLRDTEDQLRQLQKMDLIGQLTGGIAHDFNNLLTIIMGNLELLGRSLDGASARAVKAVRGAMSGATRAATLTQRLLAFAQRQPLRPTTVDLNRLITGMDDLIHRTQGEQIGYEYALADHLPPCFCDANQLETALLNLVVNARDAMPQGGRLRIATSAVTITAEAQGNNQGDTRSDARGGVTPGQYVVLSVSDTGTGMPPEVAERVFEPFYTTKDIGKGTGLGLSMVYGFVRQSSGHIELESAPGRGTTLRIMLPALATEASHGAARPARPSADEDVYGEGETILVAEDDPGVRGLVVEVLEDLNYRVIEASDAEATLAIIARPGQRIDLLLSDVVMPGMNGRDLANRAREVMPHLRILFMTGYLQNIFVQQGRLDPDIELIEKPFSREVLALRVRAMLKTEVGQPSTV